VLERMSEQRRAGFPGVGCFRSQVHEKLDVAERPKAGVVEERDGRHVPGHRPHAEVAHAQVPGLVHHVRQQVPADPPAAMRGHDDEGLHLRPLIARDQAGQANHRPGAFGDPIIDGAAQGIISGSFVVFALMFLSALFLGRFWCGWFCPAGALQDYCAAVTNKPGSTGKANWIKWIIWVPWFSLVLALLLMAGRLPSVDFFYQMKTGITVNQDFWYVTYYFILALFAILPLVFGRRAGCHTICWMAPFMILGRKLRNLAPWPALRLKADADQCNDCLRCTRECPMILDVHKLVRDGSMEHAECILCGTCRDVCPKDVLCYSFSAGK